MNEIPKKPSMADYPDNVLRYWIDKEDWQRAVAARALEALRRTNSWVPPLSQDGVFADQALRDIEESGWTK